MADSKRNSILCPRCHRLVSRDESLCPYCGLTRPGAAWKGHAAVRGIFDGDRLIRMVIALCTTMFIVSILIDLRDVNFDWRPFYFLSPGGSSLFLLGGTGTLPIDYYHRWWSLLSANYLHGGLLHILFNMVILKQIGTLVNREFGSQRMFSIYTLSGVAGFYLSYLVGIHTTIGASAAVCGLMGAAIYYGWSRGGIYGQAIFRQLGTWAIAIFVFGLLVPGINNWGHAGGMAAGILLAMGMGYNERRRTNRLHQLLFFACLAATLLVLTWALVTSIVYRMTA